MITTSALAADFLTPAGMTRLSWIVFAGYWLVAAFGGKQTKRHESWGSRLSYWLPTWGAVILLTQPRLQRGWLAIRFLPPGLGACWIGAAMTVAGVAIAVWARRNLGGNWSGTVTLKEGHELIRSGPYRRIRHPIYTGILLALLGTAIEIGRVAGLIGFAVIYLSFWVKARHEESFLTDEFGASFEAHRQRTGMFLPKFG